MSLVLVVVSPFSVYKSGDIISDSVKMDTVLQGENANHVVRVNPIAATPLKAKGVKA